MTCITEPASCDNGTLRAAVSNADVPGHFGMGETRCDEPYAMVDADVGAGACPVDDTGPNRCAGQDVRRKYWKIHWEAWTAVASDPGPGCGRVTDQVPDFPTQLCADLPAVPPAGRRDHGDCRVAHLGREPVVEQLGASSVPDARPGPLRGDLADSGRCPPWPAADVPGTMRPGIDGPKG
jgi:hypothetical protein